MIFRRNYNYRFISKECFDFKCLEIATFNDIYRKYKIVKYKKNDEIFLTEVTSENLLKNIENIINIYDAEKILSSCIGFDGEYEDLTYYHISDLYFIEFSDDVSGNENENELIEKELKKIGLIQ